VYHFSVKDINGRSLDLSAYKGKKILIVNTASECGYTPQYEALEALYMKNKDHLVIIGFPANNFGGQEPGTNADIASFCTKTYHVTFPMASKISVKGADIDPLFQWLTSEKNPDFTGDIKWNFEKFLLDENGVLIHRYRSATKPSDPALSDAVKN
jgi:glutathione peroxidase